MAEGQWAIVIGAGIGIGLGLTIVGIWEAVLPRRTPTPRAPIRLTDEEKEQITRDAIDAAERGG